MYFDYVEEKKANGRFDVFAINEQENQTYLLRNIIIQTSYGLEGPCLKINSPPETYVYRGKFQSVGEMEKFLNNVLKLINEADRKNSSVHSA